MTNQPDATPEAVPGPENDELIGALRTMLRTRAGDVTAVPDALHHTAQRHPRTHHRGGRTRALWGAAAAAAVVLAVAGGVVALERGQQSTTPARTNSVPASPLPTTSVTECAAGLPASWAAMMRAVLPGATIRGASRGDMPLATRPDGSVLIARDSGTSRSVVLIAPDGTQRVLVTLPDRDKRSAGYGAFVRGHAVIGLIRLPRDANGVGTPLMQILLVALDSGHVHTITTETEQDFTDGGQTAEVMGVVGNTVYWDHRDRYNARNGTVESYNADTGRRRTVYRGEYVRPDFSAGGVAWDGPQPGQYRVRVAATDVPAAVLTATSPAARTTLTTDGTRWAWYDSMTDLVGWYDGRRVRIIHGKHQPGSQNGAPEVFVAGHYLLFPDTGTNAFAVVDGRTGATATLPSNVTVTGSAGTVATTQIFIDKFASQTGRADIGGLAALNC